MKNILLTLALIFTSIHFTIAEKYALIISVGDYPDSGGWPDISSQNDVYHVKEALASIGFSKSNISTISDMQATKEGILISFAELTEKIKPGDIVYIHFSGHGQQAADDDGDELDRLDEAIVPYDSPLKFKKGVYEGERLIRDDLLGELTQKIRSKCGSNGQVILVLDSCHSGTGTRGLGKVRGTATIMAPDDFKPNFSAAERKMKISNANNENLAPMASFFGASSRELNYETIDDQSKPVGSLSYAVSSVLATMKNGSTFEDFFERIKLKMKVTAPRQNPQWEGPENLTLLGGEIRPENSFYRVADVIDDYTLTAELGTLTEVYDGSVVEVYSKDREKTIAKGEVKSANLTESTIKLSSPLDISKDELIVVKVIERAQPSIKVAVSSTITNASRWGNINNELLKSPLVKTVDTNADLFISECSNETSLQVATKDGTVLFEKKYDPARSKVLFKEIENEIKGYVQADFLRSYETPGSNFDFKLELVDCKTNRPYSSVGGEEIELKVGSCIEFKITNVGLVGAYYSLIDIQPNNEMTLLIPSADLGTTAEEYYLKPGESFTTNYIITIYEPLGNETLKLITSKVPQDLSGIMTNKGRTTRGFKDLDPFEKILAATYNETSTRGVKVRKPKSDEIGTSSLYFKITQ